MNILDLVKQKQGAIAAQKAKSIRTIKPFNGKHMYRILPGWKVDAEGKRDPKFWQDYGVHYIKPSVDAKASAVYICNDRTNGEVCDVCEAIKKAKAMTTDDEIMGVLSEAYASQRYLVNVLHLTGEKDKRLEPQIMEFGPTIFNEILELFEEYGDVTGLEKGTNINIKRSGAGRDTDYSVMPSPKALKLPAKILEGLNDLSAVTLQDSDADLSRALTAVGQIIGIMPPGDTAKIAAKSSTALEAPKEKPLAIASELAEDAVLIDDDMPEVFDDTPFEVEDEPEVVAKSSEEDELSDLDDLLGDLDDLEALTA